MTPTPDSTPGRIVGIGGIFFKAAHDHKALKAWYQDKLGIVDGPHGVMFPAGDHPTIWSIFSASTTYLDPSKSSFMINYVVDDMDAYLAKCTAKGVKIDPKRQDEDYGRFAWIYDPDGNKLELWQPLP